MTEPRRRRPEDDEVETYQPPTPNMAAASLPTWLDPITGRLDELPPEPEPVVELEPIEIVGDPNAPRRRAGAYSPPPAGTRDRDEPKPMNVDAFAELADAVLPSVEEDARTGLTGIEIPAWAAAGIANEDGTMPSGPLGALTNLLGGQESGEVLTDLGQVAMRGLGTPAAIATGVAGNFGEALGDRLAGRESELNIDPEERTVYPVAAAAGYADVASRGLADNIVANLPESVTQSAIGLSPEEAARDLRGGFDWARREMPGSTSIGEGAAMLQDMAIPGPNITQTGRGAIAGRMIEPTVTGFAEGYGRSEGETPWERARTGAGYALAGAGLSGLAARSARNAAQAVEDGVDQFAVDRARRGAAGHWTSHYGGGGTAAAQRRLQVGGTADRSFGDEAVDFTQQLRRHGMLGPDQGSIRQRLANIPDEEQIARQGHELRELGSRQIGEARDFMSRGGRRYSTQPIADAYQAEANSMMGQRALDPQRARMQQLASDHAPRTYIGPQEVITTARPGAAVEDLPGSPDLTWDQLQALKTQFRQSIPTNQATSGVDRRAYAVTRDSLQDLVEREGGQALGDTYRAGRQNFRFGQLIGDADDYQLARGSRNRLTGLTNTLAYLTGSRVGLDLAEGADLATGSGLGTIGSMAASALGMNRLNQAMRAREHAVQAVRLERHAELLMRVPEIARIHGPAFRAAAEQGPRVLASAIYLASQRDPRVRQLLARAGDGDDEQSSSVQALDSTGRASGSPDATEPVGLDGQPGSPIPMAPVVEVETADAVDFDDMFDEPEGDAPVIQVESADEVNFEEMFQ